MNWCVGKSIEVTDDWNVGDDYSSDRREKNIKYKVLEHMLRFSLCSISVLVEMDTAQNVRCNFFVIEGTSFDRIFEWSTHSLYT